MSFDDLGLSQELLQAVSAAGYASPTPIQQQAIPVVLMGRDVLGCAQTGTGKTAGFTLPMIATPGRLMDLFDRGKILLSDVKILVIDEADRMLDMGFIPDVERIVSLLPKIRQTLFFSATMPPEIRRLADAFLSNPKEISVAPPASPAATVEQALVVVEPRDKREALRRLIRSEDVQNALIFCNRKVEVDVLYK